MPDSVPPTRPPGPDARLLDLASRWLELRRQGKPVSVAELCADCPHLVPGLQSMLDDLEHAGGLPGGDQAHLATPTPGYDTTCGTPFPQEPLPSFAPFEVSSRYVVEALLGEGGMGAVYRARDRKLDRAVALKVIRPGKLSADLRERFEIEARAVARLDHPHIVKIYDVGEWQSDQASEVAPYLALELVPGGSLAKKLGSRALPPHDAARLVRLLALGMAHAHERGIVHRDLKPDNVLMGPPADEPRLNSSLGCPKVTDFGLARQVDANQRLTQAGMVMGTPEYMAPEQAEGQIDVGPPADVHALGLILYRLLTGKTPFGATSLSEVLYKVSRETPPPPSQVCADVPGELERICMDCLKKAPELRPRAAVLAGRLDRFLGAALEPSTQTPCLKAVPRPPSRRRILGLGLAGVAVGLGGVGLWLGRRQREPGEEGPPANPDAATRAREKEPAALTAELTVRVWAARMGKKGLRIGVDEGAVPVREDEQLQMEVKLNQPGYAFLLWLDGKGTVTPLYPWNDQRIDVESLAVPPPVVRVESVRNPSLLSKGWPVDDTAGLDTILLLARREPWPPGRDLATLLGKVPTAPLREPGEVVVRGWDRGQAVERVKLDLVRRPKKEAREIDDQLTQVVARLAKDFEVIRAVQFAHVGKGR